MKIRQRYRQAIDWSTSDEVHLLAALVFLMSMMLIMNDVISKVFLA